MGTFSLSLTCEFLSGFLNFCTHPLSYGLELDCIGLVAILYYLEQTVECIELVRALNS
jgi:hypothetical protein